jgi:hypothetical protein
MPRDINPSRSPYCVPAFNSRMLVARLESQRMTPCLFLSFRTRAHAPVDGGELAGLEAVLRATPELDKALVHTAAAASDPYVKDEGAPQLVLQLYFAELAALESALARSGPLAVLTSRQRFATLADAEVAQQAMVARPFAVPEPVLRNAPGMPYCTYLVSYEGEAEDLNAWHAHYLASHTVHMARFPGLRELEVYTRLDWVSGLPWPRVNFMQRNKVAFDSPEALTEALHSPVRHEMRADYKTFPPFTGPTSHFAMATRVLNL